MTRFVLLLLLFAPLSTNSVEVVVMDYSDLVPGEIDAYHYDLPEPEPYTACYCPW